MRRAVLMPFLISFLLMSAGLLVGASRPQGHVALIPVSAYSTGSVDKTLLTATTGTGCVNCHSGAGVTAAFTASASTTPITTMSLYPGESANLTIRATTTSTATGQLMGTNIAANGGTLGIIDTQLVLTTGTTGGLGKQLQHSSSAGTLKTVTSTAPNFYNFSYTLTNATVPATTSIAGVAVVDYGGGGQHTSMAVTSRRPADTSNLAAGTPTQNSIPLSWAGTGPAYRVIAKPGTSYPTGPTDTSGAVVNDVSTTSDTVGGLSASTSYAIGVWGRASFSPYDTYSTTPSMVTKSTAGAVVTTWYVNASTGNDSNSGSSGSPFQTITHANNVALSGDTILVSPGTYKYVPPC